jgi:hypothetical protein
MNRYISNAMRFVGDVVGFVSEFPVFTIISIGGAYISWQLVKEPEVTTTVSVGQRQCEIVLPIKIKRNSG